MANKKNIEEIIKLIGNFILQGLSEREAALLSGISEVELENIKHQSPSFVDFLDKKKVEFKLNHLEIINKKSDPRTSQWLLEKIFPEQFASKKVAEAPQNIFAILIKEVQKNNNKDVIKRIEEYSGGTNTKPTTLQDILK